MNKEYSDIMNMNIGERHRLTNIPKYTENIMTLVVKSSVFFRGKIILRIS